MKLKEQMITHSMDDSQIMVSTDKDVFSGIVTSNETAAFIVDQLKQDTTPEVIKQAMMEKYDAPAEVISRDVDNILNKFRSLGIIEE